MCGAGNGAGGGEKGETGAEKVPEKTKMKGKETGKTSKFLRKFANLEENENFFKKGVDICFPRGKLLPVRRERDKRKNVRGARADWF